MNKKDLKAHFITIQQDIVKDHEATVQRYQAAADLDENDTIDPDELSHQTEATQTRGRMEQLLREAEEDLDVLEEASTDATDEVMFGSIVDLGDLVLYITVAAPKFEYDGRQVLPMSVGAPVYQQLEGKKKGDKVMLGDKEKTIEAVY